MAILAILGGALLLALVFGPTLWVRHELHRAGTERGDLPGTGAELARHLLDEAGLQAVRVEPTTLGDHYDPAARAVRLLPQHHDGRSIAAVAVAAHEVGHAVQDAWGEPAFRRRQALVRLLLPLQRAAQVVMIAAPLIFLASRSPPLLALNIGLAMILLGGRVAVHAVTLPVEFDASFGKALPVLQRGGYLAPADLPQARRVLRAAALTYVAAALLTLVDIARWFRR
ncbi:MULTISPECIES: zinc metallopeptidase [Roseomonadaceae]|uniref:Zinc metallopeptidase n=1 Tax=Falsiroseomonas oleicola TaxID=2801474 RepID=A0ABS6H8Y4_9PROT|nr:zinc metallopeptidase [Roseomonas oleicola]MBU8544272.1 zinc metallopeptidase [Roseomonas oleicola]